LTISIWSLTDFTLASLRHGADWLTPPASRVKGRRFFPQVVNTWGLSAGAIRGLCHGAGHAPITRASGKKLVVLHRKVKNQRLAAVGYLWAFASLRLSTGARAHYDRRRVAGDRHTAAQRHLFNRFLGCLYYCLQTGQTYAEAQAFPAAQPIAA
jgi:hypothetical protein